MKRNFLTLALAAAFGMALLGSASKALAACAPGTTNGGLVAGNYAIKIGGAITDTGGCFAGPTCPDPSPNPISGLGVIHLDGTCDITAGELILNQGGVWSSPTSINLAGPPFVPAFTGTMTAADSGSYSFNSNNVGTIGLFDAWSGLLLVFGVQTETGGAEFRGARINSGDPMVILGEKQAAGITAATFLTASSVSFDAGSGGTPSSGTGVGFDAVQAQALLHLDPETLTTPEGGGSIFFNVDNGYDSSVFPGFQILPPGGGALVCDFHQNIIEAPSTSDGTYATDAALDGDFSCPLVGAHFENVSLLWGSANQYGWLMTTGDSGVASGLGALGGAGKATATGIGHMSAGALVLVSSNINPAPSGTLTLTNDAAEPIDFAAITVSTPDVTIVGGTCNAAGGQVASNSPLFGPGTCTITLQDTGAQCTTAPSSVCTHPGLPYLCCTGPGTGTCAGVQSGLLEIWANDHTIAAATQTATGVTLPVTCK